jgi:hypothetical protein
MNETYLIINILLIVYCIGQIATGAVEYSSSVFRAFSTIILSMIAVIMLLFSAAFPFGDTSYEIKPATNTRVGNELIIQAEGWPTQVINNIEFIDKEVQIRQTHFRNVWGGGMNSVYQVESIKTEVE